MISFQTIYGEIANLVSDNTTNSKTLYKALINQTQINMLALRKDITETSATDVTISAQQSYPLPYDYGKMIMLTITVGAIAYPVEPIEDDNFWRTINARSTSYKSDIPSFYYIYNNLVYIYPKPASDNNTITYYYHKTVKDMSVDDYTTGSVQAVPYTTTFTAIVAADATTATLSAVWGLATGTYVITFSTGEKRSVTLTNASAAVTWTNGLKAAVTATITIGNSVGGSIVTGVTGTWTSAMAGRYIRVTSDGFWYRIYNYIDATHVGLERVYAGAAIAAGTEAYIIGEMPLIPESYHELLIWRPVAIYLQQRGEYDKAMYYWMQYDGGYSVGKRPEAGAMLDMFINDRASKNESSVISPRIALAKRQVGILDPNAVPLNLTS